MPELLPIFANLGAGALLGWFALPLFARITAVRFVHDPAASHRALLWAFILASLLVLVPWARAVVPHVHVAASVVGSPGRGMWPSPAGGETVPGSSLASTVSVLGFDILCGVGAAWCLASSLTAALVIVSLIQLGSLLRRSRSAPAPVRRALSRCRASGVEKVSRICVSDEASVPFAAVPWSPVIVLPASFSATFDDEALDLILEHEVTHLDRGDLWASALVRALGVLIPFHPTASRLANDLAFAREAAVDVRVSARDPHRYATLLVDVAAHARFDQIPRPVSMDDTALKRRIEMLTDELTKRPIAVMPVGIAAALLAILTLAAPPVFGAIPPAEKMSPPPSFMGDGKQILRLPDASYEACEQKNSGDTCAFTTPISGEVAGICAANTDDGRLFCAPPPPQRVGVGGTTDRGDE